MLPLLPLESMCTVEDLKLYGHRAVLRDAADTTVAVKLHYEFPLVMPLLPLESMCTVRTSSCTDIVRC